MDISKEAAVNYLATNIKHLRKQLAFSQEELANRLGLNRGNIASYEKGTAEPKICNLLNLSNFFRVSVMDLTSRDLHCPHALKIAKDNYQYELKEEDKVIMEKFFRQAEELENVMRSLRICQTFKMKCIDELPEEMKPVISNFDQLCTAGEMLMTAHNQLLEFVRTRMK